MGYMLFILVLLSPIGMCLFPFVYTIIHDLNNNRSEPISHEALSRKEERELKSYRKLRTESTIRLGKPIMDLPEVRKGAWFFTASDKEKWIMFDNYEVADDDKPHRVIYKNYTTCDRIYRDLDRMGYDKEYRCKKAIEDCENKVYTQKYYEVRKIQTDKHKGEYIRYDTEFNAYFFLHGSYINYCSPEGESDDRAFKNFSRSLTLPEYVAYGAYVSNECFGDYEFGFKNPSDCPEYMTIEKTEIRSGGWKAGEIYKVTGIDFQKYHQLLEEQLEEYREKCLEEVSNKQKELEKLNQYNSNNIKIT